MFYNYYKVQIMIKTYYILMIVLLPLILIVPQQGNLHPDEVKYPVYMDKSPALINMKLIPPAQEENETLEGREIPNHVRPNLTKSLIKNENFIDPVIQNHFGPLQTTATIVNFDGLSNACSCYPPDPNGDVGLNHIIQSVNSQFQIWNKTGTSMYGPANLSTLWTGTGGVGKWEGRNDGDPVVMYDQFADRWLISQFALPNYPNGPFYELIAISSTSDPLGAYNRYIYTFTDMPDYPKFGVWSDGYYMSANVFASGTGTFKGVYACAMERDSMLAGKTARIVTFNPGTNDYSMLPSDADGNILPPAGAGNLFMEIGSTTTTLIARTLNVNWANTALSTFSAATNLTVAAYDENMCNYARNCIPQSGTTVKIDAISDRLMHRIQYRNFGAYQSMVVNHTVDAGSDHAAVRWYEFRNTGSGWSVYQQSSYAPDATHRWMGSIAMDGDGNIAAGFSNSSSTTFPSIKYAGRYKTDALNSFTISDQTMISGGGSQTGTGYRWGDYSMMTVDPSDDATFWYINEYYSATSSISWKTRIASFKISSLALSSPIGGEFWTNGSSHIITWSATGVSNVKLEYSTDNGVSWNLIIASTSGSTGSYAWTLPALSYDQVKVRITDLANSSLIGQSSNYFSVANNTSTLSPAVGPTSSTSFTGTGITFTGFVTVSGSLAANYYSANIASGTLPSGVKIVSPYFWTVKNTGTTFTNGKMIVPLSFLSGVGNSSSLRWLKRTLKTDAWTNIGGIINGSNLESNVAFSSFSEFAIGSIDSSNFVPNLTLNLTALIEAMYVAGGNQMSMTPTVTVELHNATSPFAVVESKTGNLTTSGVGSFIFNTVVNGTPYYIVLKYLNTVETWSATTQSFTAGILNYDFTTGVNKAYTDGSNLPLALHSSKYCIYSGDVNQDHFVTNDDFTGIDNDASLGSYNIMYDLNGDGFITNDDFTFIDNNSSIGLVRQVPTGASMLQTNNRHFMLENKNIKDLNKFKISK
jgi:hypothetical protein